MPENVRATKKQRKVQQGQSNRLKEEVADILMQSRPAKGLQSGAASAEILEQTRPVKKETVTSVLQS